MTNDVEMRYYRTKKWQSFQHTHRKTLTENGAPGTPHKLSRKPTREGERSEQSVIDSWLCDDEHEDAENASFITGENTNHHIFSYLSQWQNDENMQNPYARK